MKDEFGDRMKEYEGTWSKDRIPSSMPMAARIDGQSFSKFTSDFDKPFDKRLTFAMDRATMALVEETKADIGYTQSDEITLLWADLERPAQQRFFDGRVQKLCSVLAGIATTEFTFALIETAQMQNDPRLRGVVQTKKPHFDCRIWGLPDRGEAANTLLWRCQDARKNAVSSFARQYVSHKAMQGLDQKGMLDAAYDNGAPDINAVCTTGELFGRYFQRVVEERTLTEEEWLNIPETKRPPREHKFVRSRVAPLDIAYFGHVGDQDDRIKAIFG